MDPTELAAVYEKEEQLKAAIVFAREYLKGTKVSTDQLKYLCEEAIRGGCPGHRYIW
jgi:magnesium chelatase subunit D